MDTQQVSAPSRAPSAGVVHINIRLTDGYSIISNRLSQHRDMSLLAIGLGTHIQSLPAGRRIGVKALAAIFPESEARIAAALRELERHGFLRRIRERVQGGRVATRTESYNHPEAAARRAIPQLVRVPEPVQEQVPEPVPVSASEPVVVREPAPAPPAPAPAPAPAPRLVPSAAAPKPPPPPLPFPRRPSAPLFDEAARLLAGLHVSAPLFALSEVDVERLTPGVAAWLERVCGRTRCGSRSPMIRPYPSGTRRSWCGTGSSRFFRRPCPPPCPSSRSRTATTATGPSGRPCRGAAGSAAMSARTPTTSRACSARDQAMRSQTLSVATTGPVTVLLPAGLMPIV
ncbi:hypothetical protein GCM10010342_67520 [Streptomyces anulatus]|nr:hypothetical protein GCM10010342_67520 [Streptomyces anulatus]